MSLIEYSGKRLRLARVNVAPRRTAGRAKLAIAATRKARSRAGRPAPLTFAQAAARNARLLFSRALAVQEDLRRMRRAV